MDNIPFNFASIPPTWELCFNERCPRKDTCMHYLAGQHLPADKMKGNAIYPNALQEDGCKYFVERRLIRAAWGFHKLYLNVKHVDDTPIRHKIQAYLGSRTTYYRYMNGKLTLSPEQQEGIARIFREYGYTEEPVFDHYIYRYAFE